jgi:hypothetical protein
MNRMNGHPMTDGPGLFEVTDPARQHGARRLVTNVRRLAGAGRAPGSVLIGTAAWLLVLIGGGALYVSFTAQQRYIFAVRHQNAASVIEALLLDLLMIVFTLLALGLARAGKPSRTERALILVCAAASAYMNVAAADVASPRSVTAYILAPLALAVVVDRVVAVIRRHVLADDEPSAWITLARATTTAARIAGLVTLYSLRFILAAPSTAKGLRRTVLNAAPLPPVPRGVPGSDAGTAANGTRPAEPYLSPPPTGTVARYTVRPDVPEVRAAYLSQLDALRAFAGDLAAGQVPSIRQIRRELRVGQDKAQEIQAYLKTMIRTPEGTQAR